MEEVKHYEWWLAKNSNIMTDIVDKYLIFRKFSNDAIAAILVVLVIVLFKFFSKVPSMVLEKYRTKKYKSGMYKASAINNIMNHLGKRSGAIYVHIVRYHNGGREFATVEWEETGNICTGCTFKDCFESGEEIPLLQSRWQRSPLKNDWIAVVEKSINLHGQINKVVPKDLDEMSKKIWEEARIVLYKEVFLKIKHSGVYTLGLSFCKFHDTTEDNDALIFQLANQLRHLL